MNCKYKKFSNERLCQIMNGECQFLLCMYGLECPIYQAFKNWDSYWAEGSANTHGGTAQMEQIMAADMYDDKAAHPECITLDLDFD